MGDRIANNHNRPLPLEGIRVLDLGQIYNGAYAGFLLAQAGADVVKVEPPRGDNLRNRPVTHGAWYPFVALNINKRSVCLDLKTPSGREQFLQLVAVADVVLENFSPGVMDRLGVGYEAMWEANPRLIYASSSGYGEVSRYRDRPAMDLTVQAMVGVTSVTGYPDAPPVKAGVAIADFVAGVHMYGGIVSALCGVSGPARVVRSTSRCSTPRSVATVEPGRRAGNARREAVADRKPTRRPRRGAVQRLPHERRLRRDHLRDR